MDKREILKSLRTGRLSVEDALVALRRTVPAPAPEPAAPSLDQRFVADLMRDIAGLLKMRPDELHLDTPLADLGVDSIAATQFTSFFTGKYGIKLSPTIFFEFRDARGFATHVLEQYRTDLARHYEQAATPRAAPPIARSAAAPKAAPASRAERLEIEQLWNEVEATLVARTREGEAEPRRSGTAAARNLDAVLISPSGEPPIEVMLHGSGPPLLLLGGIGSQADLWKYQIDELSRGRKLVMFHQPGCGRSGVDADRLTLDGMVDNVCKVLDTLNIPGPIPVVSYSYGGMLAQLLCLDRPGRVSAMVVACSTPRVDRRSLDVPALLREVAGNSDTSEMYRRFNMDLVPIYERCSRDFDVAGRLRDVAVPTLVLVGKQDAYMKPEFSRAIHDAIPDSRLKEVDGAGHLVMLTHSEVFNRHIVEFLEAAAPTR